MLVMTLLEAEQKNSEHSLSRGAAVFQKGQDTA